MSDQENPESPARHEGSLIPDARKAEGQQSIQISADETKAVMEFLTEYRRKKAQAPIIEALVALNRGVLDAGFANAAEWITGYIKALE